MTVRIILLFCEDHPAGTSRSGGVVVSSASSAKILTAEIAEIAEGSRVGPPLRGLRVLCGKNLRGRERKPPLVVQRTLWLAGNEGAMA